MYFNYHAKVKSLIKNGQLTRIELVNEYHGIKPAMLLYFKNSPPMPIREHMWAEYFEFLSKNN